jgi:hypothetical protein
MLMTESLSPGLRADSSSETRDTYRRDELLQCAVDQPACALTSLMPLLDNVSSDLRESEQVILSAHTRCRHTTYELALLSIIL